MKNTQFVHGILCPFCSSMCLKMIPINSQFEEFEERSCFCSECGRHAINIIPLKDEVA